MAKWASKELDLQNYNHDDDDGEEEKIETILSEMHEWFIFSFMVSFSFFFWISLFHSNICGVFCSRYVLFILK